MNIRQAIERVSFLKKHINDRIDMLKAAEKTSHGSPARVSVSVFVDGFGTHGVSVDREVALGFVRDDIVKAEAEIANIQPVIDMANAALKGVLSDGIG